MFEGVPLPGVMMAVDHLGMHDNLPEMSEATSLWLFRFTICVGQTCRDTSANIIRHVSETLTLIQLHRAWLIRNVPKHWDGAFDETVIDGWMTGLITMLDLAGERTQCSWIA